jgi:hypothetical protein
VRGELPKHLSLRRTQLAISGRHDQRSVLTERTIHHVATSKIMLEDPSFDLLPASDLFSARGVYRTCRVY